MIILMKPVPIIPAPHILVSLLKASDPDARKTAAFFLVEMLRDPDPLIRWGTVSFLVHTPLRLYLEPLVKKLQEEGQPEPARIWARHLNNVELSLLSVSPSYIIRVFSRTRFLLYLTADLHRISSNIDG
jgi:hypothetical protein